MQHRLQRATVDTTNLGMSTRQMVEVDLYRTRNLTLSAIGSYSSWRPNRTQAIRSTEWVVLQYIIEWQDSSTADEGNYNAFDSVVERYYRSHSELDEGNWQQIFVMGHNDCLPYLKRPLTDHNRQQDCWWLQCIEMTWSTTSTQNHGHTQTAKDSFVMKSNLQ